MNVLIQVVAWPIGAAPFYVPVVLAVVLAVPRWRRRVLRPVRRRRAARRERAYLMRQAVIEARTGLLEAQLEAAGLDGAPPSMPPEPPLPRARRQPYPGGATAFFPPGPGGSGGSSAAWSHAHGPDDPCNSKCTAFYGR